MSGAGGPGRGPRARSPLRLSVCPSASPSASQTCLLLSEWGDGHPSPLQGPAGGGVGPARGSVGRGLLSCRLVCGRSPRAVQHAVPAEAGTEGPPAHGRQGPRVPPYVRLPADIFPALQTLHVPRAHPPRAAPQPPLPPGSWGTRYLLHTRRTPSPAHPHLLHAPGRHPVAHPCQHLP